MLSVTIFVVLFSFLKIFFFSFFLFFQHFVSLKKIFVINICFVLLAVVKCHCLGIVLSFSYNFSVSLHSPDQKRLIELTFSLCGPVPPMLDEEKPHNCRLTIVLNEISRLNEFA